MTGSDVCSSDLAKDKNGNTALTWAARNKNTEVREKMTRILQDPEAAAQALAMPDTEFLALCRRGTPEAVSRAIKTGANVNAKDDSQQTALMQAAVNHPEVVSMLIAAGADVNEKDNCQQTALMHAATANRLEIVAMLLAAGADVHAKTNDGRTTLIRATVHNANARVIAALLRAGADVHARDNDGKTALRHAVWESSPNLEVVSTIEDRKSVV